MPVPTYAEFLRQLVEARMGVEQDPEGYASTLPTIEAGDIAFENPENLSKGWRYTGQSTSLDEMKVENLAGAIALGGGSYRLLYKDGSSTDVLPGYLEQGYIGRINNPSGAQGGNTYVKDTGETFQEPEYDASGNSNFIAKMGREAGRVTNDVLPIAIPAAGMAILNAAGGPVMSGLAGGMLAGATSGSKGFDWGSALKGGTAAYAASLAGGKFTAGTAGAGTASSLVSAASTAGRSALLASAISLARGNGLLGSLKNGLIAGLAIGALSYAGGMITDTSTGKVVGTDADLDRELTQIQSTTPGLGLDTFDMPPENDWNLDLQDADAGRGHNVDASQEAVKERILDNAFNETFPGTENTSTDFPVNEYNPWDTVAEEGQTLTPNPDPNIGNDMDIGPDGIIGSTNWQKLIDDILKGLMGGTGTVKGTGGQSLNMGMPTSNTSYLNPHQNVVPYAQYAPTLFGNTVQTPSSTVDKAALLRRMLGG